MRDRRTVWWSVGLLVLSLVVTVFGIALIPLPEARAANPAPPTMTVCVKVAEAVTANGGIIETFRCDDKDNGNMFYQNSLGFMLPWKE